MPIFEAEMLLWSHFFLVTHPMGNPLRRIPVLPTQGKPLRVEIIGDSLDRIEKQALMGTGDGSGLLLKFRFSDRFQCENVAFARFLVPTWCPRYSFPDWLRKRSLVPAQRDARERALYHTR